MSLTIEQFAESVAEYLHSVNCAHARTAMTPWRGLATFQRDHKIKAAARMMEKSGITAALAERDAALVKVAAVEALCDVAESFESMQGVPGHTITPSTVWTKIKGRPIRHQELRAALATGGEL